ncbi:MAG: TIGR02450 family Trp-rich protein [Pseudomonadota bacterium]
MNQINPRKLLHSKWTAVAPANREKHFIVNKVEFDDDGAVTACELQAVLTRRSELIDWRSLKDSARWQHGWQ